MSNASTVLVVENEPDIMEFVRTVLLYNDLNVASATNGEEALSYLKTNAAPAMILLDFSMPNMDGFEFRARKLKDERLRTTVAYLAGGGYLLLGALLVWCWIAAFARFREHAAAAQQPPPGNRPAQTATSDAAPVP